MSFGVMSFGVMSFGVIGFASPLALLFLPLALAPFAFSALRPAKLASLDAAPPDAVSSLVAFCLRAASVIAIGATALAAASPYREGRIVHRTGEGAEVAILIDRSASMNETFAGRQPSGEEESKAAAAKHILDGFIGRRAHDLFGVTAFSTSPMLVMPMTDHREAVARGDRRHRSSRPRLHQYRARPRHGAVDVRRRRRSALARHSAGLGRRRGHRSAHSGRAARRFPQARAQSLLAVPAHGGRQGDQREAGGGRGHAAGDARASSRSVLQIARASIIAPSRPKDPPPSRRRSPRSTGWSVIRSAMRSAFRARI